MSASSERHLTPALRYAIVATLLTVGLNATGGAQSTPDASQTAASRDEVLKAATSDKSPGALLIAGNEGSWSLVSDGQDSRLIAKIGWQSPAGALAFGFEGSATLQKNKTAVELLNLDGLAAGDASVAGQVSYRSFFDRTRADLESACSQVNLEIETQIRGERGGLFAEPLRGEACTLDALREAGGSWASDAEKVTIDTQAWACGELSKLNPDVVLVLQNKPLQGVDVPKTRFGKTGDCTRENFIAEATKEAAKRQGGTGAMAAKAKIEAASAERDELEKESKSIADRLPAVVDPMERQRLSWRRFELVSLIEAQAKVIAESEAELEKLVPALLTKPAPAYDTKEDELQRALCKRYNEPDRSSEIQLQGFKQTCVLGPIETSISTLNDARVRNRLRLGVISNLPMGVWAVTLRGGVTNRDFEYVDPAALPGFTTFEALSNGVTAETKRDSLVGVAGTVQFGASALRLGYDRKKVHQGGDSADICVPVGVGSAVDRCAEASLGKPKPVKEGIATLEYRRLATPRLGIAIRALYLEETVRKNQLIDNEWEGHLVLYFLTDKSKGLNGGIDVAYDWAFEDARARLFIGQSFDLFN